MMKKTGLFNRLGKLWNPVQKRRASRVQGVGAKPLAWRKSRIEELESRELLALSALTIAGITFTAEELALSQGGTNWAYTTTSPDEGEGVNTLILNGFESTNRISAVGDLVVRIVAGTRNCVYVLGTMDALHVDGNLTLTGSYSAAPAEKGILELDGGLNVTRNLTIARTESNGTLTPQATRDAADDPLTLVIGGKTVRYYAGNFGDLSAAFGVANAEAAAVTLSGGQTGDFTILLTDDIEQTATLTVEADAKISLISSDVLTISRSQAQGAFTESMFVVFHDTQATAATLQTAINTNSSLTLGVDFGMGTSSLTIDGGAVWDNISAFAQKEGGIEASSSLIFNSGTLNMYDGVILQNNARTMPILKSELESSIFVGGVFVNGREPVAGTNATTVEEAAGKENGGALFNMKGGLIRNCYGYKGGGVGNIGNFDMSAGTITGCYAYNEGGGVRNRGQFNLSGGTISYCGCVSLEATSGNNPAKGGGIHNSTYGYMHMTGGTVTRNYSYSLGGGIYIGGSGTAYTFLENGVISYNRAARGGGMAVNSTLYLYGDVDVSYNEAFTLNQDGTYAQSQKTANGQGMYVFYNSGQSLMPLIYIKGNAGVDTSNDVYVTALLNQGYLVVPIRVYGELTRGGVAMLMNGTGSDYRYVSNNYDANSTVRYTPIVEFTEEYYRDYAANHGIADWRTASPLFSDIYAVQVAHLTPGHKGAYFIEVWRNGAWEIISAQTPTAGADGTVDLTWKPVDWEDADTRYRVRQGSETVVEIDSSNREEYYDIYAFDAMTITQQSKFILVSQNWELTLGMQFSVEGVNTNAYNDLFERKDKVPAQQDTANRLCLFDSNTRTSFHARVGNIFFVTLDEALNYVAAHAAEYSGWQYGPDGEDGRPGTDDDLSPAVIRVTHNSTFTESHEFFCDTMILCETVESFFDARFDNEQDYLWEHFSDYDANGDGRLTSDEIPANLLPKISSMDMYYSTYNAKITFNAREEPYQAQLGAYSLMSIGGKYRFETAAALEEDTDYDWRVVSWSQGKEGPLLDYGETVTGRHGKTISFFWGDSGQLSYGVYVKEERAPDVDSDSPENGWTLIATVTPGDSIPIVTPKNGIGGTAAYDGNLWTGQHADGKTYTYNTIHIILDKDGRVQESITTDAPITFTSSNGHVITLPAGTTLTSYIRRDRATVAAYDGFIEGISGTVQNSNSVIYTVPAGTGQRVTITKDSTTQTVTADTDITVTLPPDYNKVTPDIGPTALDLSLKGTMDMTGSATVSVTTKDGDGDIEKVKDSDNNDQYHLLVDSGELTTSIGVYSGVSLDLQTANQFVLTEIVSLDESVKNGFNMVKSNCTYTVVKDGVTYSGTRQYGGDSYSTYTFRSCNLTGDYAEDGIMKMRLSGTFVYEEADVSLTLTAQDGSNRITAFNGTVIFTYTFTNAVYYYNNGLLMISVNPDQTHFAHRDCVVTGEITEEARIANGYESITIKGTTATRVTVKAKTAIFTQAAATRIVFGGVTYYIRDTSYVLDMTTGSLKFDTKEDEETVEPLTIRGVNTVYTADRTPVTGSLYLVATAGTATLSSLNKYGSGTLKVTAGSIVESKLQLGTYYTTATGTATVTRKIDIYVPEANFAYASKAIVFDSIVHGFTSKYELEISGEYTTALAANIRMTTNPLATEIGRRIREGTSSSLQTGVFTVATQAGGTTVTLGAGDGTHLTFDGYQQHSVEGTMFLLRDAGTTLVMNNGVTILHMRSSLLPTSQLLARNLKTTHYGGAVTVTQETAFVMNGGLIELNCGYNAGGVAVNQGGTFHFNGGTIRDNEGGASTSQGTVKDYSGAGAVWNYGGTVTVARTDVRDENGVLVEAVIMNNVGKFGGIYNQEIQYVEGENSYDFVVIEWQDTVVGATDSTAYLIYIDGEYQDTVTYRSSGSSENGSWIYDAPTKTYHYCSFHYTRETDHHTKIETVLGTAPYIDRSDPIKYTVTADANKTISLQWIDASGFDPATVHATKIFYINIDGVYYDSVCPPKVSDFNINQRAYIENAFGSYTIVDEHDGRWTYTYTPKKDFAAGSEHTFYVYENLLSLREGQLDVQAAGAVVVDWSWTDIPGVTIDRITVEIFARDPVTGANAGDPIARHEIAPQTENREFYGNNVLWRFDNGAYALRSANSAFVVGEEYNYVVNFYVEGESEPLPSSGTASAEPFGRFYFTWTDTPYSVNNPETRYRVYIQDPELLVDGKPIEWDPFVVHYGESSTHDGFSVTYTDPDGDGLGQYLLIYTNQRIGKNFTYRIEVDNTAVIRKETPDHAPNTPVTIDWSGTVDFLHGTSFQIFVNNMLFEDNIKYVYGQTDYVGQRGTYTIQILDDHDEDPFNNIFLCEYTSENYSSKKVTVEVKEVMSASLVTAARDETKPETTKGIRFTWKEDADAADGSKYKIFIEDRVVAVVDHREDGSSAYGEWTYDAGTGTYAFESDPILHQNLVPGQTYGCWIVHSSCWHEIECQDASMTGTAREIAAYVRFTSVGNAPGMTPRGQYSLYVTNPTNHNSTFVGAIAYASSGSNEYGTWTYDPTTETYNFTSATAFLTTENPVSGRNDLHYHYSLSRHSSLTTNKKTFSWAGAAVDSDNLYVFLLLDKNGDIFHSKTITYKEEGFYDPSSDMYYYTLDVPNSDVDYQYQIFISDPQYCYVDQTRTPVSAGALSVTFGDPVFADAATRLGVYLDGVLQETFLRGTQGSGAFGSWTFDPNAYDPLTGRYGQYTYTTFKSDYAAGAEHRWTVAAVVTADENGEIALTWSGEPSNYGNFYVGIGRKLIEDTTERAGTYSGFTPGTTYQWCITTGAELLTYGPSLTPSTGDITLHWTDFPETGVESFYILELNGSYIETVLWHDPRYYDVSEGTYSFLVPNQPAAKRNIYSVRLGAVGDPVPSELIQDPGTREITLHWSEDPKAGADSFYVLGQNGVYVKTVRWRDPQYYNPANGTYTFLVPDQTTVLQHPYLVHLQKTELLEADPNHYLRAQWRPIENEVSTTTYSFYVDDELIGVVDNISTQREWSCGDKGKIEKLGDYYMFLSNPNAFENTVIDGVTKTTHPWFVQIGTSVDESYFLPMGFFEADLTLYGGSIHNNTNLIHAARSGETTADADGNVTVVWQRVYATFDNPFTVVLDGHTLENILPMSESGTVAGDYGTCVFDSATQTYAYVYTGGFTYVEDGVTKTLTYAAGDGAHWEVHALTDAKAADDPSHDLLIDYEIFLKVTTVTRTVYHRMSGTEEWIALEQDVTTQFEESDVRKMNSYTQEANTIGDLRYVTLTETTYEEAIRGNIAIYNMGRLTIADNDVAINPNNLVYLGFRSYSFKDVVLDGALERQIGQEVRNIYYETEKFLHADRNAPIVIDTFTKDAKTLVVVVEVDVNQDGVIDQNDVKEASQLIEQGVFHHISGSIIQKASFDLDVSSESYLQYKKTNELVLAYGEIKYVNHYSYRDSETTTATALQIDTVVDENYIGGQTAQLQKITDCFAADAADKMVFGKKTISLFGAHELDEIQATDADNRAVFSWSDPAYAAAGTHYIVRLKNANTGDVLTDYVECRTSGGGENTSGSWEYNAQTETYTYTSEMLALGSWTYYVSPAEQIDSDNNFTVRWKQLDGLSAGDMYYFYVNGVLAGAVGYDPAKTEYTRSVRIDGEEGDWIEWSVTADRSGHPDAGAAFSHAQDALTGAKYYFIGWNTERDGSGKWFYPTTTSRNTITISGFDVVYAIWGSNIVNTLTDRSVEIDTVTGIITDRTPEWTSLREAVEIALYNNSLDVTDDHYDAAKSSIVFELDPVHWEQADQWAETLQWVLEGTEYTAYFFPAEMTFVLTLGTMPTITSAISIDGTAVERSPYAHPNGTSLEIDGTASGGIAEITWNQVTGAAAGDIYYIYVNGVLVGTKAAEVDVSSYTHTVYSGVSGLVAGEQFDWKVVLAQRETVTPSQESSLLFSWNAAEGASAYRIGVTVGGSTAERTVSASTAPRTVAVGYTLFYDAVSGRYTIYDPDAAANAVWTVAPIFENIADETGTLTLEWSAVEYAVSYEIYLGDDAAPIVHTVEDRSQPVVQQTLGGRTPGAAYQWRVVPRYNAYVTDGSSVLKWAAVPGAVSYHIDAYYKSGPIEDEKHADVAATATSYNIVWTGNDYYAVVTPRFAGTVSNDLNNVTLTWDGIADADYLVYINEVQVAQVTGNSYTSPFLAGETFTWRVESLSGADVNPSGTDAASTEIGFADLTWTEKTGAYRYDIYVQDAVTGRYYRTESVLARGVNGTYSGLDGTSYVFENGTYTWSIETTAGQTVRYRIETVLASQSGHETAESSDFDNVTIDFAPVAGASRYDLYINDVYVGAYTETSVTTTLAPNSGCVWRVEPVFDSYTFTWTGSPIPLSWIPTAGADYYEVTISNGVTFTTAAPNHTITTLEAQLWGFTQGTDYTFTVRACADSDYGESDAATAAASWKRSTLTVVTRETTYNADGSVASAQRTVGQSTYHYLTRASVEGTETLSTVTYNNAQDGSYTYTIRTTVFSRTTAETVRPTDQSRMFIVNTGTGRESKSSEEHTVVINGFNFSHGGVYTCVYNPATGKHTFSGKNGGAIAIQSVDSHVVVENALFTDNIGRFGGSINNWGYLTLNDCVFKTTLTANNVSDIEDAAFANNVFVAHYGGAVYNVGTVVATGIEIYDMWVDGCGGGISNNSITGVSYITDESKALGHFTLDAGHIKNCFAVGTGDQEYGYGGGFANWGEATIRNNTQIIGCYASENGGGITNGYYNCAIIPAYAKLQSSMLITDSFVTDNIAEYFGGGIMNATILTIAGTSVSDNTARRNNGGGIANSVYSDNTDYLRDPHSTENWKDKEGHGELTIIASDRTTSTVNGNTAAAYGGGIADWGASFVVETQTSIAFNTASYGGGVSTTSDIDFTKLNIRGFANPTTGDPSTNTATRDPATNDVSKRTAVKRVNVTESTAFLLLPDAPAGSELVVNNGREILTVSADRASSTLQLGLSVGENDLLFALRDSSGVTSDPISASFYVDAVTPTVSVEKTLFADSRILKLALDVYAPVMTRRWVISWGDGEVTESDSLSGSLTATHCYRDEGIYGVTLEITDVNGNVTRRLIAVHEFALPAQAAQAIQTAQTAQTAQAIQAAQTIQTTESAAEDAAMTMTVGVESAQEETRSAAPVGGAFLPTVTLPALALPNRVLASSDSDSGLTSEVRIRAAASAAAAERRTDERIEAVIFESFPADDPLWTEDEMSLNIWDDSDSAPNAPLPESIFNEWTDIF